MECEYADMDFLVLMLTPENRAADIERFLHAFGTNDAVLCAAADAAAGPWRTGMFRAGGAVCSTGDCTGGTVAGPGLRRPYRGCPPAIPIAVSGERIGPEALELFRRYGVEQVEVLR